MVKIWGIKLKTNVTTPAVMIVIKIAPVAAPPATWIPFFLLFCTDSLIIRAIIKPGLKATLTWRIINSIITELETIK